MMAVIRKTWDCAEATPTQSQLEEPHRGDTDSAEQPGASLTQNKSGDS
jgi:hypothetical protein